MANDILRNIGQGMQSFLTATPLSQIQNQAQQQEAAMQQQKLQRQQQLIQLDNQRKQALFEDARTVNTHLKSGQIGQALNTISSRLGLIEQLGGDTSDTREIADLIASNDIGGAMGLLDSVELAGVQSGYLQDLTPKAAPSEIQVGATVRGRDENGNPRVGQMVFDKKTRKANIEWADGGSVKIDKLSDLEKSEIKLAEAKAKAEISASQKGQEVLQKRRSELRLNILKTGREAARGINDLNRLEKAIDAYGTGKLEQFKKLAGPFVPGIDPTNPQAMTAMLNKAVFPVLAAFSGAISDGERAFAAETVANLGNTPEANKIIIAHMKRAIQDEIDKRDQFNEFAKGRDDFENFQFTPVDFQRQQVEQPSNEFAGFKVIR